MTVRILAALALALFFLGLALGHVTASRSSATVIPASVFHRVELDPQESRNPWPTTEMPSDVPDSGHIIRPDSLILDPAPSRSLTPRAVVAVPVPELVTRQKAVVALPRSGVTGPASWYDDPRKAGLYAAAGPALRVGDWRGRTVTVCASSCFAVVLSDFCGCPGGRVIDLSGNAFARLAPLSRGVVNVTVSW